MALKTFDELQTIDRPTGKPLASLLAVVVDHLTGAPVTTYDLDGNVQPVYSNRWGVTPSFRADCDVARMMIGPSVYVMTNLEASIGLADSAAAAQTAAEQAQADAAASAQAAQDAANLVGAPAKAAMDAAMGGDVAGLVPAVAGKAPATVANPGLTAQPPTRRRDLAIDVVTEGNVPTDGATPAQAALLAGINLAAGRRAYIRKGTYKLTGRLDGIPQGTVIEGEPGTVLLISALALMQCQQSDILWKNITFRTDTTGTERFLFSTTASTTNQKNWRFERCVFDGVTVQLRAYGAIQDNNVAVTSWTAIGSGVEFWRCETTATKSDGGIWAAGCDDVWIDDHYFHDLGTSGTQGEAAKASYGAKGFRVRGSRFVNCTRDAIDLYDAVGALVDGNEFRNIGVCAVEAKRLSTTTKQPVKHRIVNNRAINCATTSSGGSISVFTVGTHYLHASGNIVEDSPTASGFRFGGAIDNPTGSPQKGGQLIGNSVVNCGGNGFTGNGTVGATIIGNYAEGNGGAGFSFPTSANTSRNGSATNNVSISNAFADIWA